MDISHKFKSPNFNERIGYDEPDTIILHYTGMESAEGAITRLCDPAAEVSAHYVIDENGQIFKLVPEYKRAWHAGKSYWQGQRDMNSASIGIELVNPGHEFGYTDFVEKQIQSLIGLCKEIMPKYEISPARVLGHSDIAVTRKIDPGHLFPWQRLAAIGIGLWPEPDEMDNDAALDLADHPDALGELLITYGYDPNADFPEIVTAFHRHYAPEKFSDWRDMPDKPDLITASNLLSLFRLRNDLP
jgi:N-acetylmuramoyl-L-alanine amidase